METQQAMTPISVNAPVLVLNQNYEPLNVCRIKRAVILVLRGKAEVVENGRGYVHSADELFQIPSVIRLIYLIKRPFHPRKLTRLEVFSRDKFTCQYCAKQTRDLTIDHVMPRRRGGKHTWENVVSACIPCNRRKADRTPEEANMRLLSTPSRRQFSGYSVPYQYLYSHSEWNKFVRQNS